MFYVDEQNNIVPVHHPDKTELSQLIDYERERQIIIDNTKALLGGKPAANILLTGDAGTGKSSTVKAVANALWDEGLRIIEVRKDQLSAIPKILDELSANPLKFILFIDDLSFLKDDDNFNALKAVLEGSVTAKSKNVVIYATSNRRHIIKEKFSDREGDDIHRNDTMQEMVSLSERFGIHITFSKPNKETFLNIVHHLAQQSGIDMSKDELNLLAERFALERGGRSARLARQFIDGLLSRI
ncbi:MAG: ATP-binding protein [Clostridia bacterium]|nr:ATP-binding protein [Clostridia bacterium]